MGGRGPFRRRALLTPEELAGEPVTDDFLRCAELASKMTGELVLEELDRSIETALTERSRAGATGATGRVGLNSSSGNKEYQLSAGMTASPWNMGDVS